MCGIAGVLLDDGSAPHDAAALRAVSGALAHRGPDGSGEWVGRGVALAHTRLSIVDVIGGGQPLANEDGTIQTVLNGEIYNFKSLRDDLEARGHTFRSRSDTEVLVHLYEEYGEDFVERLRGMFAFALWDDRRRQLLLARDRVGLKPLYLWRGNGRLVFASELKALLAHPGVGRAVDPAALEDYLAYGAVVGTRSIFHGIERFPAAHTMVVRAGKRETPPKRYWSLHFDPDYKTTPAEWSERIRTTVDEAVRTHLTGDVPIGAFLSGGFDSSVVVGSAASSGVSLPTFSMGFEDKQFDETPFASAVSRHYGTEHYSELLRPDAGAAVETLARYFDEPFADPAAVPTLALAKAARVHVKAVLSGDGGDEAFGGYSRYAHDLWEGRWRARVPTSFRRGMMRTVAQAWPKSDWLPRPLRMRTFLTNVSLDADSAYANSISICRPPLRRRLLSQEMRGELGQHDSGALVTAGFANGQHAGPLSGMLAADMAVLLPDDYLVKVDRASMAHGIEVRPPLLDHHVLELAARIPPHLKVHRRQTKLIFRRTFAAALPSSIVRRRKHGFDVPLDAWMKGPLKFAFEERVLGDGAPIASLIDVAEARNLFESHQRGASRQGAVLWSLLVLAAWGERYL
jgi:asparagine synthase (glutamine-hydrolysing)